MCLALPARLIERRGATEAVVELGGVRKTVSIALVPDAAPGDYVIVHVGHAIGMIDPLEAERTLALFAELQRQPQPQAQPQAQQQPQPQPEARP
jgi:hydrogenase expression/formation protein HypC